MGPTSGQPLFRGSFYMSMWPTFSNSADVALSTMLDALVRITWLDILGSKYNTSTFKIQLDIFIKYHVHCRNYRYVIFEDEKINSTNQLSSIILFIHSIVMIH